MTAPIPMPEDFPEHATQPLHALADRYGVGRTKVLKWRKELGIAVPPDALRGNGNAAGNSSRGKTVHGMDDIEAVRTCLSCTRGRCSGSCSKVH